VSRERAETSVPDIPRLRDIVISAADLLMRHNWKVWFWGDSIGFEGLLDVAEWLSLPQYEAFVYGMMKAWGARHVPPRALDYTAPGLALLRLWERTGDAVLLTLARKHAEYLAAFRRTDRGAYVRFEDPQFDQAPELPEGSGETASIATTAGGPCIFVDNMHFDGPFFAKLYQLTGEHRYRELAVGNILPSIELLWDEQHHLFHHFWSERLKRRNEVFWGRGQGWAMLGITHVLEYLPQEDPAWSRLLEVYRKHCRAMAAAQDPSGHWHTVITDPSSYLETSVAAFMVAGLSRGLRHGWIELSYRHLIDRAFSALLASVTPEGKLDGVSYETYPSLSAKHYRNMPQGAIVPWGQGPLLAAIRSSA
jgi:unsaturated rhamnogalacturonyl hydrolase